MYIILFILLAIVSMLCLMLKKSKVLTFILVVLFIIISVYCKEAADYKAYLVQYQRILDGTAVYEPLYMMFIKLSGKLNLSYDEFKFLISLVEILVILFITKKYTPYISFVLMLYLLYPLHIQAFLTRFLIGFVLTIIAFYFYTYKKNNKMFFIFIIMAGLVHNVFLFFICVPVLMRKSLKFTIGIVSMVFISILGMRYSGVLGVIMKELITTQSKYEAYILRGTSIENVIKVIIIQLFFCFIRFFLVWYAYSIVCIRTEENSMNKYSIDLIKRRELSQFVLKFNIIMFLNGVFMSFGGNFARIYQVADYFNYIHFANCLSLCKANDSKRKKVIILTLGYASVMLINYYVFGSDGARDDLWQLFWGNEIWKFIFG